MRRDFERFRGGRDITIDLAEDYLRDLSKRYNFTRLVKVNPHPHLHHIPSVPFFKTTFCFLLFTFISLSTKPENAKPKKTKTTNKHKNCNPN